jgi:hypothetical protein
MTQRIEEYSFGRIVIGGRAFRRDVIVFPDRVVPEWWRQSGHRLDRADLDEVLSFGPDLLIVGTGASGIMQVPSSTVEALGEAGIEVRALPTDKAVHLFNEEAARGRSVAGAFHLTC